MCPFSFRHRIRYCYKGPFDDLALPAACRLVCNDLYGSIVITVDSTDKHGRGEGARRWREVLELPDRQSQPLEFPHHIFGMLITASRMSTDDVRGNTDFLRKSVID